MKKSLGWGPYGNLRTLVPGVMEKPPPQDFQTSTITETLGWVAYVKRGCMRNRRAVCKWNHAICEQHSVCWYINKHIAAGSIYINKLNPRENSEEFGGRGLIRDETLRRFRPLHHLTAIKKCPDGGSGRVQRYIRICVNMHNYTPRIRQQTTPCEDTWRPYLFAKLS